ncbi:hypothetical protein CBS63078_6964 [Aspergillus niger]|uniref:Short chain dehydrogenase family protein n=2 Tax=Aspergillus TaxID=5052 RepID=A0A254U8T1_ASPNG|nr:hypothetical protein ANI_1_1976104 [Aspergillus niger CBS 513.88]KAI2813489.1 hypothetical protein CBS115989_9442 [Aspergillus niger]RDK45583.1 hypothetical protein M752DRAFT_311697 [Aspergillus phoenicis ATCC 13157]KAI2829214.1 hypothetical protein CBS133816_4751 [Aspergillus niger]KAI2834062.1 hypothetical protein CBS11350_10992 [Aspergillus niger]KAI2837354.1 hypothetical protein CBS12448_10988 [Aspergillus niger]|eukprot:XP_001395695.2 hypothetical protein ANI_1_1976104 [Aspergillus niger CBS 513.88]
MDRSPLGQLGKLPYEIRLEIYEKLFTIKNSPLKILRCSRAIYGEITDRLYDTLNIHLSPVFNDPWIEIHCKRLRLRWIIPNHSFPCQHRFARAPYYKMNLVVHIYAPDPRDPGQIALLWQKVQYLVYILERATISSIVIRLRVHQGRDWQKEGRVVESIPYPNKSRPDHHIVFLPFCRLSNVRAFRVVPDTRRMDRVTDWGLINYGRDFILNNGYRNYNDGPLSQDRQYRDIVREFDDIDALIRDTDFFLETHLDTLHGNTAAMLRLDRAAHWPLGAPVDYTFRLERSLLDIRQYPGSVNLHDPGLKQHCLRMWAFCDLYLIPYPMKDKRSWEEWCSLYPEGLRPHDHESIHDPLVEITDNPGYFGNFDTTQIDGEYEINIHNYWQRNWNGRPAFRRRRFEQAWCTDCRRIGYRTGCDQDCEKLNGSDYEEDWEFWSFNASDYSDPDVF